MKEEATFGKLNDMIDEMFSKVKVKIVMYCPLCEEKLQRATTLTQAPKEGDVTVCPCCFGLLGTDENLGLVEFTLETWQALGEKTQRELKKFREEVIEREEDGQE